MPERFGTAPPGSLLHDLGEPEPRSNVRLVAAVINILRFKEPVDPSLFETAGRDLGSAMGAIEGFEGVQIIQTSEAEVVLLIFGDTVDVLNRIATEVGSPWMSANVVPLLAGPPERHIGPTIASWPA